MSMRKKAVILSTIAIFVLVASTVYFNIAEQRAVDRSKIPEKVELSKGFQKWITNLKNKDFIIGADEFRLVEENEIYNTKWMKVNSIDEPGKKEELELMLKKHSDVDKVEYSPSKREFIDYRNIARDGYLPNEVRLYGLKEDKILDARILDCSAKANCYFDRAYFLDNDVFVISEISRNIDKKDETTLVCLLTENCEYTFKVHVIDLVNNSRLIYESDPFTLVLNDKLRDL